MIGMKRILMLGVCLAAACKSGEQGTAPTGFDQKWAALANAGADPAVIEGDSGGTALVGELRRATDQPTGALIAGADPMKGQLPDEQVVRVIRSNLAGVKGCYQVAERTGSVGSGKAIMSVEIQGNGEVSSVSIDAPAFQSSTLPGCMSDRAKSWAFPKFTQGPKRFSYPFVFVGG
jgi:hypothetical protein